MIIVPQLTESLPEPDKDRLEEGRDGDGSATLYEPMQRFVLDHASGLQVNDDQYIIDPDYAELLNIDNFEDLIVTKR